MADRHTVLTIAGSDSCGAAGLQADLATIARHGMHGLSALTAVTAQTTAAVTHVHPVPVDVLVAQLHAVLSDCRVHAAKTGMLGSTAHVRAVAATLAGSGIRLVVDPVCISTSGTRLLSAAALDMLATSLLPHASLVTPNLPELAALGGDRFLATAPCPVLITGGHADGATVVDRLFSSGREVASFSHPRLPGQVRGTGCRLTAAIACGLAAGHSLELAIGNATDWLHERMQHAFRLGSGGLVIPHGT
jgi:hydroxymethylpyrimidine/phosphomethylpyrimidine kinase